MLAREGKSERAIGWFNLGCSYLDAAEHLIREIETGRLSLRFDSPVSFLLGHGLELLLKAQLRLVGMTDEEVRKIGHNLQRLLTTAEQKGLNFSLTDIERGHLSLLNDAGVYAARYLKTGAAQVHDDGIILVAARRIEDFLRPSVLAAIRGS